MKKSFVVLSVCIFLLTACQPPTLPDGQLSSNFSDRPTAFPIQPADDLNEASGLADSHKQPGLLWSHEDAASPNELFLINRQGQIVAKMITPFGNLDWEDIAIGPGPITNETYLYVGDIGDNANSIDVKTIYRFIEPSSPQNPITNFDRIRFRYPDGTFDAETLLLDPITKDLYVVTKWLANAHLYRLPYPQNTESIITAQKVGQMTIGNDLTGGSISTDGREIIVRGYSAIHYWQRKIDEPLTEILLRAPLKNLPYVVEPQGEAVCFDKDGKGYFTLSERRLVPTVNLYFYERR
ncbi:MAG: PE-PGRS family protein [Runella sp.]